MQNVALAWLVVELTHSPLAVGMLAFCRFILFTVFGLAAGVVADRIDNRKLVITTQVVSMTFATILATLVLTGSATLWLVLPARDPPARRSSSTPPAGTRSPSRWSAAPSC